MMEPLPETLATNHEFPVIVCPACAVQLRIGLYTPMVLDLIYIYQPWLPQHDPEQWMSGFPRWCRRFRPCVRFLIIKSRVSSCSSLFHSMVPVAKALQSILVSRGFWCRRSMIIPDSFVTWPSILHILVTTTVYSWYIASRNIHEQANQTLSDMCLAPGQYWTSISFWLNDFNH